MTPAYLDLTATEMRHLRRCVELANETLEAAWMPLLPTAWLGCNHPAMTSRQIIFCLHFR